MGGKSKNYNNNNNKKKLFFSYFSSSLSPHPLSTPIQSFGFVECLRALRSSLAQHHQVEVTLPGDNTTLRALSLLDLMDEALAGKGKWEDGGGTRNVFFLIFFFFRSPHPKGSSAKIKKKQSKTRIINN